MAVMKKRGSMLVFISIITLLAALLVLVVYPMVAKAYASGEVALKVAAARDIALILDTMYAYPYDMEIGYDFDLSEFAVDISGGKVDGIQENKVKIYSPSLGADKDPVSGEYPFAPVNDEPDFILYKPKKIVFEKKEGKIRCSYQNNLGNTMEC